MAGVRCFSFTVNGCYWVCYVYIHWNVTEALAYEEVVDAGVVVATLPANGECPQGLWGLGSDRNMVCFDNLSVRPLGK